MSQSPVNTTNSLQSGLLAGLLLAVIVGTTGCGLPAKWQDQVDKLPQSTPEDPAVTMLCIWEPAEGIGPDHLPTRGFAGKITFFPRRRATGVRVKGDVMVSVYDDQGKPSERGKPIRQWEFLGDAWTLHLQDSKLGPSYSVFIPYTRPGNHQAQCALRVRLTPEQGMPIYSETASVILPGPIRKRDDLPLSSSKSSKRTSLESISIPFKEKQKAEKAALFAQPLGEMKIHRVTAPASELANQPQSFQNQPIAKPAPAPQVQSLSTKNLRTTMPTPPPITTTPATVPNPLTVPASAQPISTAPNTRPAQTGVPNQSFNLHPGPRHPLAEGNP